jgi:hypothetical protein
MAPLPRPTSPPRLSPSGCPSRAAGARFAPTAGSHRARPRRGGGQRSHRRGSGHRRAHRLSPRAGHRGHRLLGHPGPHRPQGPQAGQRPRCVRSCCTSPSPAPGRWWSRERSVEPGTWVGSVPVVLRHVALFRWAEGTTEEQRRAISEGLSRLPNLIPELRDYRFGEDLGLAEDNWDFAVVADFDSAEGWSTYRKHPEHERILSEQIRPAVSERASLQYEL